MFYYVSFQYSDSVYCANIAEAQNVADVERHYSKYSWVKVSEAQQCEVETAKKKGMPIVKCEHIEEPAEAEQTESSEENAANLTDSNGEALHLGDIVEVSGGYFKNSNGLFFLEGEPGANGSVWLRKLNKSGKLPMSGDVQSWPLTSYCSDPRKSREAKNHNRTNAKITKAANVNTWHVAEWLKQRANDCLEKAERERRNWGENDAVRRLTERADRCTAAAERLSASATKPAEKEPEKGIRFYYNGIKVDGGKLIPCFYNLDSIDGSVSISARNYDHLPAQYFTVKNDSDPYTDYFDSDRATLDKSHPLYRFARFAGLKCIATGHSWRKLTEAQAAEWAAMKDPGQPTAADLAAVEEMKTAAESARLAKEHAAQLEARENYLRERNAGRQFIEQTAAEHPITEGAPVVVIEWSEHPAFQSWEDGQLRLSVAAAEIILKHYDEERSASDGYDKTKFTITWTESGEECTYTGRYDLGDNDGGLVQHIRSGAEYALAHAETEENTERARQRLAFAEMLQGYTTGGYIVSVEVPEWVKAAAAEMKRKREEQARHDLADLFDAVQMLTDEQIEGAVFAISPADQSNADVARFFLQELSRRDREKALDVFRRWRDQRGGATA